MTPLKVSDVAGRNPKGGCEGRLREAQAVSDFGDVHDLSSQTARNYAIGYPRNNVVENNSGQSHNVRMAKQPTKESVNYLRAWRERANLTQEELADKVGTAGNVIGLLESGERGLSGKWLRRLAPHLGTTAGHLLDYHPDDVDASFLAEVIEAGKTNRAQVLAVIRALKTGTNG